MPDDEIMNEISSSRSRMRTASKDRNDLGLGYDLKRKKKTFLPKAKTIEHYLIVIF